MTIRSGRRRRYLLTVPVLTAGTLAAVALTACTSSHGGSDPAPTAPIATVGTPAARQSFAAAAVLTYPTAGSHAASPQTQISLRGVAPTKIGTLRVTGSRSGSHPGTMRADSDGNGASFYPAKAFTPGEKVTVSTSLDVVGAQAGSYSFTVSRPTAFGAQPRTEPDDASQVQSFRSDASLRPPKYTITHGSINPGGGDVFIAPRSGPGQDGPMIVDATGQLVWYKPLTGGISPCDFRMQS